MKFSERQNGQERSSSWFSVTGHNITRDIVITTNRKNWCDKLMSDRQFKAIEKKKIVILSEMLLMYALYYLFRGPPFNLRGGGEYF